MNWKDIFEIGFGNVELGGTLLQQIIVIMGLNAGIFNINLFRDS